MTTEQLAKATGASLRQIHGWRQMGVIRPSVREQWGGDRSGHDWSVQDCREVAVIAALQRGAEEGNRPITRWRHVVDAMRATPDANYLVTDGYECDTFTDVAEAAAYARSLTACTLIAVDRLLECAA